MVSGEKKKEIRKPSDWIKSRMLDKQGNEKRFDVVKFTNGYGSDKPFFIAKYLGFYIAVESKLLNYSNGLIVKESVGDVVLVFGGIIEKGNL